MLATAVPVQLFEMKSDGRTGQVKPWAHAKRSDSMVAIFSPGRRCTRLAMDEADFQPAGSDEAVACLPAADQVGGQMLGLSHNWDPGILRESPPTWYACRARGPISMNSTPNPTLFALSEAGRRVERTYPVGRFRTGIFRFSEPSARAHGDC